MMKPALALRVLKGSLFALAAIGVTGSAIAQAVPRSFVASPDVYKVIAQSNEYLVIEVTWKPGQRDKVHSHPADGGYYLTDCSLRWINPGGATRDFYVPAGFSFANEPIASHSMENTGKTDCKLIMFEPK